MTDEFARRYHIKTGRKFDSVGRRIRYVQISIRLCPSYAEISHSCLVHIINIATQKFISTYSKSAFYEPDVTTDAEPEYNGNGRDVVGLIRATAVKVRPKLTQVL